MCLEVPEVCLCWTQRPGLWTEGAAWAPTALCLLVTQAPVWVLYDTALQCASDRASGKCAWAFRDTGCGGFVVSLSGLKISGSEQNEKGSVSAKLLRPCYIICGIDSSSRSSAEAEVGGHEGEGQALWLSVIEQYILILWFSPFAYLNEDCCLTRTILVLYRKWKLEGMKVTGHIKAVFLQYDFSIGNEM